MIDGLKDRVLLSLYIDKDLRQKLKDFSVKTKIPQIRLVEILLSYFFEVSDRERLSIMLENYLKLYIQKKGDKN